MTEEPKDVRLPFMVTASEAKAIDKWRYENHVPSRAEAMRLLINRGLIFDDYEDASIEMTRVLSKLLPSATLTDDDINKLSQAVGIQSSISKSLFHDLDNVMDTYIQELEKKLELAQSSSVLSARHSK